MDCFPTSEQSMYIRLRAARGDLDEAVLVYAENKFDWTTRPRVERPMELLRSDELYDYFGAELQLGDTRLAYVFRLVSGGEVRYLCEEGVCEDYDWDYGFFNYFQYPYIHSSDVMRVPEWTRAAVCYQIFPDRFRIGEGGEKREHINLKWGDEPTPKSFAGGDLRGIEEGLDYLQETGVTCIYMTPVFQSVSNHKYDIEDYYKVDPRFGGDEALRSLIEAAHARGMKVVLDGVFNHCAHTNPIFVDTSVRGRESPYWNWFFIEGERSSFDECNYKTFADVPYMPKLNTDCDEVIDYFCGVGRYWIEQFGADGWRLDVSDEISMRFLRRFREAVKAAKPEAIIIGEVWHGAQEFLRGDMYDGVMNYGLTKACLDLLAFDRIDAARAVKVVITDKTSGKIIIAADDNVMDYVVVEANGGRLTATIDKSINNLSNADVTVTVPANGSIRALDASSAAKISGDVVLNADKFAMDASSAAKIDVSVKAQSCAVAASSASKINASVEAVSCSVEASSASKITLKGSAAKCTADLSSASKLSAGEFVVAECSVNTSSAAKAVVNCTERLHADASSGSSIRYSGDCRTSINKSSGGSVGRN